MKSGNYELSDRGNHTHKFNNKTGARAFWDMVRWENSNTYDRLSRRFKGSQIVKSTYRISQTYFDSFTQFYTAIR
mgnify:CR=1 FL=1